jgi:hypothetical protein
MLFSVVDLVMINILWVASFCDEKEKEEMSEAEFTQVGVGVCEKIG